MTEFKRNKNLKELTESNNIKRIKLKRNKYRN